MSRIRSIHPGLFTDESFMTASPAARLLIIGLWCEAWDDGVFEWKPLTIKARLFPVDAVDIKALLAELEELRFIKPFTAGDKAFGAIRNFGKFQRPKKPNSSKVLPENLRSYVAFSEPVPDQFPTSGEKSPQMEDGGGREEGKEEKKEGRGAVAPGQAGSSKAGPKGSRLTADWQPSDIDRAFAANAGFSDSQAATEFDKFRDFWIGKAGAGGVKTDWPATLRNWLRRAAEDKGLSPRVVTLMHTGPPPVIKTDAELIAELEALEAEDDRRRQLSV